MKKLLIILSLFLLCGCEFKTQNQANRENIQKCFAEGGEPVATYCADNSGSICKVQCFYSKED